MGIQGVMGDIRREITCPYCGHKGEAVTISDRGQVKFI